MGLSQKILPNYTYTDYCQWEGRWELIEGIPYAMSPMPSPKHQFIANNLGAEFRSALKDKDCHCQVYQPIDVKITENTVVNPDALIVCDPITKQYLDFPPVLVIEILSPSTRLKDTHTKFELYQDFGIQYYLIVDPEEKIITTYQLKEEGKYEVRPDMKSFELKDNCTISPDLSNIW